MPTTTKTDVIELHKQYKNKQLHADEYSRQLRIALCQYLISDDIQEKIQKAGIDILKPEKDFSPTCEKEDLFEIAKELSKTRHALQLLSDALDALPENPGVLYIPNKYHGVDIISHQDWHKFYNEAKPNNIAETLTKDELYTCLVYTLCISIIITTHTIGLTYTRLLMCGANII